MASVWDDPELRTGGEFVKLENKGDRISGLIVAVRSHRFDDGGVAPQIIFTDEQTGDERTWTAGQIQAKRKLAEQRPEAGDWFSAELTDIEKRAGGKTLKHFDIHVSRGGKPAQAPPDPWAAPAAAPAADVLAQLNPEQRAALLAQAQQQQHASTPPF